MTDLRGTGLLGLVQLHNFCIDMKEGNERDIEPRIDEDHECGDMHTVLDNANLGHEIPEYPVGDRRKRLTSNLERDGIKRKCRRIL